MSEEAAGQPDEEALQSESEDDQTEFEFDEDALLVDLDEALAPPPPEVEEEDNFEDWFPPSSHVLDSQLQQETLLAWTVKTSATLLWDVEDAHVGHDSLHAFGMNGPPINILDVCNKSQRIFVANQQQIVSLSMDGPDTSPTIPVGPAIPGQANRLRCGVVGGTPVVAVADSVGSVTLVATEEVGDDRPATVLTVQNKAIWNERPISTWGIALEHHDCDSTNSADVIVSANDYCVKAWTLFPPCISVHEHSGPQPGWEIAVEKRQRVPRVLGQHYGNIPSIDMANGLVVSASLDGHISVVPVCNNDTSYSPPLAPTEESVRTTISDVAPAADDDPTGPGTTAEVAPTPSRSQRNAIRRLGESLWNACWIPIHSVCTVIPGLVNGAKGGMLTAKSRLSLGQGICWSINSIMLSQELVADWILPFLSARDLLNQIQLLSNASAILARIAIRCARRSECIILCLSGRKAWLLDPHLNIHCRKQLPFDATFAHACYAAELSTLFIAAKYDSNHQVWAVTVLRRRCSLRFQLKIHRVPIMTQGPHSMLVGMAVSNGRLFTLTAGRRLSCYRMDVQLEADHDRGVIDV